jgi:ABC-2 type transport system permease protein
MATATLSIGKAPLLWVRAGGTGTWNVYRAEQRKLRAQLAIRLLALVCALAPFAFAAVLKIQSGSPADTLFGVWVHSSGYAIPLVVLGFGGSWGFPLIAGIVAGDIFSGEDRYGTWKTVLTRSATRGEVFVGKLLAATVFTLGLVLLAMVASVLAGVLLVGDQSLVGLNGTLISAAGALGLVVASWVLCAPTVLAFAAMAVLFSVATRNGIVGVIGPSLAGLAMQLLALVGAGVWVHMLLVASAFNTWHALFTAHTFYGPLLVGLVVCVLWVAVCIAVSWRMLAGRDFAGVAVVRRPGWVMPTRVVLTVAAVIALLAVASNWGPAGVTASRLQASLVPNFTNLTLLQQRLLGRAVRPGSKLEVRPVCSRRGSAPDGPGEWSCALEVYVPTFGSVPYQQTPVTYDVSVESDGCYKAESPPTFVGAQTMRDAHGQMVVNPLFTIYGCFNTI